MAARNRRSLVAISSAAVMAAALVGAPAHADASASPQPGQTAGPQVTLSSGFGAVTVNTQDPSLTNLFLRNPDGSLPAEPLTGTNAITSSVTDSTGQQYSSILGSPARVSVGRDPQTGAVSSVHLDGIPLTTSPLAGTADVGVHPNDVAFAPDGQTAYVTNFGSGTITPVNPATGATGTPITVGGHPSGIVVAPDGDLLVSNWSEGEFQEVDPASGSVVQTIPVGTSPQWPVITPDGQTVLVPNAGSNTVTAIDLATWTVEATIPVGTGPIDIAIPPGGSNAYVVDLYANTVTPIDLATLTPLPAIPVGAGPIADAATPNGQYVVISLSTAGEVVLLNVATGQVSAPITVGGTPYAIAISPDGSTAYVNDNPGEIVPIQLATGTVLPSMPAGAFPNGNAISPDGQYLISVDYTGSTVSRYDLTQTLPSPVTEDWALSTTDGGRALQWTITQHWVAEFAGSADADPAITFSPQTVSTVWYDPSKIYSPDPDEPPYHDAHTADFSQTLDSTGQAPASGGRSPAQASAVYKLWSSHHLTSDLELGVRGGYLTKNQTQYGYTSQAGASFEPGEAFTVPAGTTRTLTLTLSGPDQYSTGYQLDDSIPDTATLSSLQDFYQSLLNGGAVSGQTSYLFGNETAGYITAYEALPDGTALNVGVPSARPASSDPYSLDAAFRNYLVAILKSVTSNGELLFGLSSGGHYQDSALWALLGLYQYVIHTGDLALYRTYQSTIATMLSFWTDKIQSNGLVLSSSSDGNYYDAINFGRTYYSTYINAFVYEALVNMADLENALSQQDARAGHDAQAQQEQATAQGYASTAAGIKTAINTVMWAPDSPHGPMYTDWIDNDNGQSVYSFMDAAQYPAIVFGIASPAQAKEILATADARLPQLPALDGYAGTGTPNVLWPLPSFANSHNYAFGDYMNGGEFLWATYYEVMARAMTGDTAGAWARLQGFAQDFQQTSFYGDNWVEPSGAVIQIGGGNEPYLQDMLLTAGALTQGILGIRGTWNSLSVTPELPSGWTTARASVVYRGRPYCVRISQGAAAVTHGACR